MEPVKEGAASDIHKKPQGKSFYRRIKALSPFPYLARARDYYVRSMSECAGRANYSGLAAGGIGFNGGSNLPKSFSTSSSRNEDDYGELVRAASQRSNPGLFKPSPEVQQPFPRSMSASTAPSVGTIDEDSPAYFPETFTKSSTRADFRYPRSRSCSTAALDLPVQTRIAV